MYSRNEVVKLANSWVGLKESNGTFKKIIDIYNSYTGGLPRGIKMQYSWPWCACTWSSLAMALRYTQIMPIEISCTNLIIAAKTMGCWQENDGYVAQPGDGVLYDWDDSGYGDNTSAPDHIGTVVETHQDSGYFVIAEGNYNGSVKKRTISINGRYIRGFITPKYDKEPISKPELLSGKDILTVAREVIVGTWGSGETRKQSLERAGYNYSEIQSKVNQILNGSAVVITTPVQSQPTSKKVTATCAANKMDKGLAKDYVTTSDLYLRNDAGTNKKALVLIPKGTVVHNYGYYTVANGSKWLYIRVDIGNTQYTGFSSAVYLK